MILSCFLLLCFVVTIILDAELAVNAVAALKRLFTISSGKNTMFKYDICGSK